MADPELLKTYLADRDAPCPRCGYNLRGSEAHACPECGVVLRLSLQLANTREGFFMVGLIGLSAGLGFELVMWGQWVYTATNGSWLRPTFGELGCLIGPTVILMLGMLAWIPARRSLPRRSRAVCSGLVVLCWLAAIAAPLSFFAFAR